jgi:hypothetical protein
MCRRETEWVRKENRVGEGRRQSMCRRETEWVRKEDRVGAGGKQSDVMVSFNQRTICNLF